MCDNEEYAKKIDRRKELFNMSFQDKLSYSQALVAKILKEHKAKKITLSYSGGIDSESCVQLFKDAIVDGRVQLLAGITHVNFPQAIRRMDALESELGITIIRASPGPGMSFRKIVEDYGLPLHSRGSSDKSKARATKMCCSNLKKKPMDKAVKGTDVLIMGLRGYENNYRKLLVLNRGEYFQSKVDKSYRVYPIAYWTIDDVWAYQAQDGFNYNPLYDNTNMDKPGFYRRPNGKIFQIRTGCWCCPQVCKSGYLEWLGHYYPRLHSGLKQLWKTKKDKAILHG